MITGLTLIFTDTLEVGDMVSISGEIGRVEKVGLRFTELRNFYNQQVFLSNRNISNISRYPRGGIHAYVDVQIPPNADRGKVIAVVKQAAREMREQFGAIILNDPAISEAQPVQSGSRDFVRVDFKLWPGQGALIETTFRLRLVTLLKQFDPNYADWMIVVAYRATDLAQANVSI
jgi:small conductance mechanosensitive channel